MSPSVSSPRLLSLLACLLLPAVGHAATPVSGITTFTVPYELLAKGSGTGTGLFAADVEGYDFRVVMDTAEVIGLYVDDLAWATGNGVQYYPDSGQAISMNRFEVSSNGGESFDLKSFAVSLTDMTGTATSVTISVIGYSKGGQVAATTQTLALSSGASTQLDVIDVSSLPAFQAIDEFRISPASGSQIGYFGIDNLHAVNFVNVPELSSSVLLGSLAGLMIFRRRR